MASYGSETSFLLIFSARDDLVKVSWESDARKCQNQLTPPYFDQLSERHQLLYRPINKNPPAIIQWGNQPKMRIGHNFWLEGPIDLRPTPLDCILQDLFRDIPLDHIWRAQICAKNAYLAILGIFGGVFILWILLLEKVQTAPHQSFFCWYLNFERGSVVMVYLIFQVTQNNRLPEM